MKKSIENRPMIIVSLSTSKWGVEKRTDNEKLEIVSLDKDAKDQDNSPTKRKIVKVKPETATTGTFTVYTNRWYGRVVLPDGKVSSPWQCEQENATYTYKTLEEALKALELAVKLSHTDSFIKKNPETQECIRRFEDAVISRTGETYYNLETKEKTQDEKIALAWYPKQNPLLISSESYQKIGMWIDGGKDYVDVSFYYNDHIQRENCEPWKKAQIGGLRIYNDGTISNFYRGKVYDVDRKFETNRVQYRSFDPRFKESYRIATSAVDLRSPKIIGAEYNTTKLCKESLAILKKAGFPKQYWIWNSYKRPFNDTYSLINFVKFPQKKVATKRSQTIDEFLSDKPFGPECENVLVFNKGVLVRLPGYKETWQLADGTLDNHKPYYNRIKAKLIAATIYEKYRVWISNDGKTRSCQEHIHDGECWGQCRWDSISWPRSETLDRCSDGLTEEERKLQSTASKEWRAIVSKGYSEVVDLLPALQRLSSFIDEHIELRTPVDGFINLLDAIYRAPKLTETFIKTGKGDLFYKNSPERYYFGGQDKHFSLRKAIRCFGFSYEPNYKEIKKQNLYQNLGVSKEQFNWLVTYENAACFMQHMKSNREPIPVPGTANKHYEKFSDIPVKHLQLLASIIDNNRRGENDYWDAANKTMRLFSYGLSIPDIEKAVKKQLNIGILRDYLQMRSQCEYMEEFHAEDWPKLPSDARDLNFAHNRIVELYNLHQANQQRYWRAEEEKRLLVCQENYDKRYNKLKKFEYKELDSDLIIVVPKKLIELTIEGQVMHHCVGSYTKSVSEGRDTIVFLRKKDSPQTPYVTIDLLQQGDCWRVDQAFRAYNQQITEEDVVFLKRWGKKNNIVESTIHNHYAAHCHH